MKRVWVCRLLLFLVCVAPVLAQDQGWPRVTTKNGATLITYQPQVDEWQNFQRLTWRQAISLTSPGASKPSVGVLNMKGVTAANTDTQLVLISGIELVSSYFPDLNPQQKAQVEQQVRQFIPETVTISMHRIVASLPKNKPAPTVQLNNTPPAIYVAYQPSILLLVDGKPALTDVKGTHLKAVVNANWPLFTDKSRYFLFTGKEWMVSDSLQQGWTPTTDLPKDFEKVPEEQEWADLKGTIPAPQPQGPAPQVLYSTQPAEMIEFNGQPSYSAPISDTQIVYATNTDSIVFVYQPAKQFYFLAAGRWFSASNLTGPWTYATPNLPADFAKIPPTDPAAVVLASVPGTPEAADAVLLAQVPTSVTVDPAKAAANVQVKYSGDPQFQPIAGTSLQYAVNTPNKVIQVGSMYYVCYQGVWFLSSSPTGPWQTATSVPQEIYSIPPSSPVYNVTYVTQNTTSDGSVQASYTAGYLGTFIAGAAVGAVIADGSGYYWPGYVGWGAVAPYYAHPATYGAAALYNPYTGAYGMGHAAYGPYGGAAWGASYNPYTGTYAHGATAYGPYGNSRSAAEAYNPYTGGYAATRQGSSPYGSWGSSVVGNGNNWAATQHASTADGNYGRAETSAGGQAAGASTVRGNTGVAQTASGDMYAGHDGNVYKNTGDGWQKYGSSGWSSVDQHPQTGTSQSAWNQRAEQAQAQGYNRGGEQTSQLNQEAQDRARGGQSADRFQQSSAGGGFAERGGEAGGFEQRASAGGGWGDHSGGGSWGGSRGSWGDRGGFSGGGRGGSTGGGRRR